MAVYYCHCILITNYFVLIYANSLLQGLHPLSCPRSIQGIFRPQIQIPASLPRIQFNVNPLLTQYANRPVTNIPLAIPSAINPQLNPLLLNNLSPNANLQSNYEVLSRTLSLNRANIQPTLKVPNVVNNYIIVPADFLNQNKLVNQARQENYVPVSIAQTKFNLDDTIKAEGCCSRQRNGSHRRSFNMANAQCGSKYINKDNHRENECNPSVNVQLMEERMKTSHRQSISDCELNDSRRKIHLSDDNRNYATDANGYMADIKELSRPKNSCCNTGSQCPIQNRESETTTTKPNCCLNTDNNFNIVYDNIGELERKHISRREPSAIERNEDNSILDYSQKLNKQYDNLKAPEEIDQLSSTHNKLNQGNRESIDRDEIVIERFRKKFPGVPKNVVRNLLNYLRNQLQHLKSSPNAAHRSLVENFVRSEPYLNQRNPFGSDNSLPLERSNYRHAADCPYRTAYQSASPRNIINFHNSNRENFDRRRNKVGRNKQKHQTDNRIGKKQLPEKEMQTMINTNGASEQNKMKRLKTIQQQDKMKDIPSKMSNKNMLDLNELSGPVYYKPQNDFTELENEDVMRNIEENGFINDFNAHGVDATNVFIDEEEKEELSFRTPPALESPNFKTKRVDVRSQNVPIGYSDNENTKPSVSTYPKAKTQYSSLDKSANDFEIKNAKPLPNIETDYAHSHVVKYSPSSTSYKNRPDEGKVSDPNVGYNHAVGEKKNSTGKDASITVATSIPYSEYQNYW